MKKIFGTDGIRGIANQGILTPESLSIIGMATGSFFYNSKKSRQLAVIGKDTRLSGYLIEPALTSGLISVGMDVLLVGPMPTPAIAMLTKSLRADLGIMISASHNPYYDNGIKIFGPDGYKLDDNLQQKIEELFYSYPNKINFASPDMLGKARRLDDAPGRYIEFAKNTFPKGMRLDGLKIVIDSANGAAYHLASKIFWELGANVIPIGDKPDGFNINQQCGSLHPEFASQVVIENNADLAIILDGDADRLILVDEKGNILDGDELLVCIAKYLQSQNKLKDNTLVCTTMSNISMERYCNSIGIKIIHTDVGDRYVTNKLRENSLSLGGEKSGHIIISEYSSTGDGIVAALAILAYFINSGKKNISDIFYKFKPVPQVIHNVKIPSPSSDIMLSKSVQTAIIKAQETLGNKGRIIVRKSGTEPVIRIMIEHENYNLIDQINKLIEEAILRQK
jgi:phosphoglucosamine mutase